MIRELQYFAYQQCVLMLIETHCLNKLHHKANRYLLTRYKRVQDHSKTLHTLRFSNPWKRLLKYSIALLKTTPLISIRSEAITGEEKTWVQLLPHKRPVQQQAPYSKSSWKRNILFAWSKLTSVTFTKPLLASYSHYSMMQKASVPNFWNKD